MRKGRARAPLELRPPSYATDADEREQPEVGTMTAVYQASPIKRRSTKVEVSARRARLFLIVAGGEPMTVRQVFYQATVRGVVEKTEAGYNKVQTDLVHMRRSGRLPYDWLKAAEQSERAHFMKLAQMLGGDLGEVSP